MVTESTKTGPPSMTSACADLANRTHVSHGFSELSSTRWRCLRLNNIEIKVRFMGLVQSLASGPLEQFIVHLAGGRLNFFTVSCKLPVWFDLVAMK